MTPWNVSHLTPVRVVEEADQDGGRWRFEWPDDSPKAQTWGDDPDLERMRLRNAKLRRAPFPVIRLEDQ